MDKGRKWNKYQKEKRDMSDQMLGNDTSHSFSFVCASVRVARPTCINNSDDDGDDDDDDDDNNSINNSS